MIIHKTFEFIIFLFYFCIVFIIIYIWIILYLLINLAINFIKIFLIQLIYLSTKTVCPAQLSTIIFYRKNWVLLLNKQIKREKRTCTRRDIVSNAQIIKVKLWNMCLYFVYLENNILKVTFKAANKIEFYLIWQK